MTPDPDPSQDAGIAGSVTGEWVEVYPPEGEPAEDEPAPREVPRPALVAIGLFVTSLVLLVLGSVLPLAQAAQASGDSNTSVVSTIGITAWQITTRQSVQGTSAVSQISPLPIGYPLLLALLLLVAAVVLRVRARRAAGVLGVVAAAFLSGLVVAIGAFAVAWEQLGSPDPRDGFATEIGTGYWILVVACVVAVAAAVSGRRSESGRRLERRDLVERAEGDQPAAGQ